MKYILCLILVLLATGCSIAVPVHEGEPPEVLDNWGFRVALLDGIAPQIAPLGSGVTSDPSGVRESIVGYRMGFGFLERFQLNFDLLATGASGGSSVSLKYQWTGDTYFKAHQGNFSQTTIVRYWSGTGSDISLNYNGGTTQSSHSNLTGDGFDVTHLFGYRPADFFGVYGGPKLTAGHVQADYKNDVNGAVLASAKRNFWGGGAIAGIYLAPHSEHIGFDFVLEYELMNLPQTYTDGRDWYSTVMLTMGVPFSFN